GEARGKERKGRFVRPFHFWLRSRARRTWRLSPARRAASSRARRLARKFRESRRATVKVSTKLPSTSRVAAKSLNMVLGRRKPPAGGSQSWRSDRDSNPGCRFLPAYSLSRGAPSATRSPLRRSGLCPIDGPLRRARARFGEALQA